MLWTSLTNLKNEDLKKKEISRNRFKPKKLNLERYKFILINLIKKFKYKYKIRNFHEKYTEIFFSRSVYLRKPFRNFN